MQCLREIVFVVIGALMPVNRCRHEEMHGYTGDVCIGLLSVNLL